MKNKGSRSLLVIGLTSAVVVAGLGAYTRMAPPHRPPSMEVEETAIKPSEPVKTPEPQVEVHSDHASPAERTVALYLPKFDKSDSLSFERTTSKVPAGEDLRLFAVNQFMKETKIADPQARLLSVSVKDGLATLSFNSAITSGFGSDDERTFVEGIRMILGQFKEIEKLEFYADGVKLDSLGHFEIDNVTVKR
ncbi:MAG: GerMN domain-containing protein [Fimbriimonadaceae bacterium]